MKFEDMNLDKKLIEGIKLLGFKDATGIQEKCIPHIKAGKDVVGQSLTGSGKTAAFGLPILEKIVPGGGIQALILTPTRELCVQVREDLEKMAKYLPLNIIAIYGGVGFFQQTEGIAVAEIIVATPGRLLDHMGRGNLKLNGIKYVVLDEADRMFDMGFEEDVDRILRTTPKSRQTVMFSATMPRAAQNIIKKYSRNPVFVQEKLQVDKSLLKQIYYSLRREEKFPLLVHLLKNKTSGPAIVFCGTKRTTDDVARKLRRQKIEAMPVHGDLAQSHRQRAVNLFKTAKIDVLVATDVAARGLDIKDVSHVYNYDVPRTPEEYTHRIGRTARIGKKGDAVTLLSERDYDNFGRILKQGRLDIRQEPVPEYEPIVDTHHDFKGQDYGHREDNRFDRRQGGFGQRRQGHYQQDDSGSKQFGRPRRFEHQRGHNNSFESGDRFGHSQRGAGHNQFRGAPARQGHFGRSEERNQSSSWTDNNSNERRQYKQSISSPRYFGQEKHSQSKWVENKIQKKQEKEEIYYHNEIKPGLDITPRTLEPLFPTSHYNPEHKKFTALLKSPAGSKQKSDSVDSKYGGFSGKSFGHGGHSSKQFANKSNSNNSFRQKTHSKNRRFHGKDNEDEHKKHFHKRKTFG